MLLTLLNPALWTMSSNQPVKEPIRESLDTPNGLPFDTYWDTDYNLYPAITPLFTPEIYREKNLTIRTWPDLWRALNLSQELYEDCPNAQGAVNGKLYYLIGEGGTLSVNSPHKGEKPPPRLHQRVTDYLNEFMEANNWQEFEWNVGLRWLVHGESFGRIEPMDGELPYLTFIEPQDVYPPSKENQEGAWSWGIFANPNYPDRPLAYNVRFWRSDVPGYKVAYETVYDRQYVFHLKRNTTSIKKRGIPGFHACHDEFRGAQRLRRADREGTRQRSLITHFNKWETGNAQNIAALQETVKNQEALIRQQRGGGASRPLNLTQPSEVNVGKNYTPMPAPQSVNSDAAASGNRLALESAAVAMNVPYWLVSGDTNTSNYATSLTAESPFVKSVKPEQNKLARYKRAVLRAAIEIGIEQGRFPEDTLSYTARDGTYVEGQLDLSITYPSPEVRDLDKLAERLGKMADRHWVDDRSAMIQLGEDPETVWSNMEQDGEPLNSAMGDGKTDVEDPTSDKGGGDDDEA